MIAVYIFYPHPKLDVIRGSRLGDGDGDGDMYVGMLCVVYVYVCVYACREGSHGLSQTQTQTMNLSVGSNIGGKSTRSFIQINQSRDIRSQCE